MYATYTLYCGNVSTAGEVQYHSGIRDKAQLLSHETGELRLKIATGVQTRPVDASTVRRDQYCTASLLSRARLRTQRRQRCCLRRGHEHLNRARHRRRHASAARPRSNGHARTRARPSRVHVKDCYFKITDPSESARRTFRLSRSMPSGIVKRRRVVDCFNASVDSHVCKYLMHEKHL